MGLSRELGVLLTEDKTEGLARCLTFLGIELDTVAMTTRLLEADRFKSKIWSIWGQKEGASERITGVSWELEFCLQSGGSWPGFLRRLCDAMKRVECPNHRIRVTLGMKQDLEVWFHFWQNFNVVAFWRGELRLEAKVKVHMDSAGSLGLGVFFHGHWCMELWLSAWVEWGCTRDLTFL